MIRKIETAQAPQAIGPYSQAVKASPFLFISGMLAIDLKTGKMIELSIEGQTHLVLCHIGEVLKAAGLTFQDVVKMEVFMKDMGDFPSMNRIYTQFFPHDIKPARHAFQVARLPLDALIEISCTAFFS